MDKPDWTIRRKLIYSTLAFCAVCVTYILFIGDNSSGLHESIASWAFTLAGSTLGSYIFGAVWDDKGR